MIAGPPLIPQKFTLWETKGIPDPNNSRYSNPEVDAKIQKLRVMVDPKARAELSKEIESTIRDDHSHIWFFHQRDTICLQPYMHNYVYGPNGDQVETWLDVWLDPGHR